MSLFQAFLMGAVQGITEFLPVSSSAHLVLMPWFFAWEDPGLVFDVLLHFGTLMAILVYFFQDWVRILRGGVRSILERRIGYDKDRLMFWYLCLGTIPAAIAGLTFHEQAETIFRSPLLIAITLSSVGFLLYWIDGWAPELKDMNELTWKQVLAIGVAQAFAIIPGVSRSGATILMGRYLNFRREEAARFSFLLSVPLILGACVHEWSVFKVHFTHEATLSVYLSGLLGAAIFGFLSIHFLLLYVRTSSFKLFAWYRIGLAAIIVVFSIF